MTMTQLLNGGVLPAPFSPIPTMELGGPVEIDVATVEDLSGPLPPAGVAKAESWVPSAPAATLAVCRVTRGTSPQSYLEALSGSVLEEYAEGAE
jgi:hypothetical protein